MVGSERKSYPQLDPVLLHSEVHKKRFQTLSVVATELRRQLVDKGSHRINLAPVW